MMSPFVEYGCGFDTTYKAASEFDLFSAYLRIKLVRKIRASRIRRLFDLYSTIRRSGSIVERDFTMWPSESYEGVSRNMLLLDLHLLEDVGLLNKTYDWPNGVSVPYSETTPRKNPNPIRR